MINVLLIFSPIIIILKLFNTIKYERKDDENNIYPFLYAYEKPEKYGKLFLSIRQLSGNITIDVNNCSDCEYFNDKNIKTIYTIKNDLKITIKANIDSIYTIEQYQIKDKIYLEKFILVFYNKGNYLFNFGPTNTLNFTFDFYRFSSSNSVAFYPNDCSISVEKVMRYQLNYDKSYQYKNIPLNEKYGIFQDLFNYEEEEDEDLYSYSFSYLIKVNESDNNKNCSFSAGIYKLDNDNDNENYQTYKGIGINYNISHSFIFEKNYNDSILFVYYFGNNYSDFVVNIKVEKQIKYYIKFYINNKKINKNREIESTEKILITKDDWKNICDDIKQFCFLTFLIKSESQEESKIDILINSTDYKQEEEKDFDDDDDDDDDFPIWLIVIIIVGSIIFIVGIVFLIIKCRNKNSNDEIEKLKSEQETRPLM